MTPHVVSTAWETKPLTDPELAVAALEHYLAEDLPRSGRLLVLLCDRDGVLLQPLIARLDDIDQAHALTALLKRLQQVLGPGMAQSVLVAVARPGYRFVTEEDRRCHRAVLDLAQRAGVTLLGTYVATRDDIVPLPAPLARIA